MNRGRVLLYPYYSEEYREHVAIETAREPLRRNGYDQWPPGKKVPLMYVATEYAPQPALIGKP